MSDLISRISDETKAAMKARDKERVAALRLINAEIKRVEVDERRSLEDSDVLDVLTRMLKQRRDSLSQFESAGREDLAAQGALRDRGGRELHACEAMSEADIEALIDKVVARDGRRRHEGYGQGHGCGQSGHHRPGRHGSGERQSESPPQLNRAVSRTFSAYLLFAVSYASAPE